MDKETKKAKMKEWLSKNKDRVRASARAWRENNKERLKEIKREWYLKNKDKVHAANRESYIKFKDKRHKWQAEYYMKSPERRQANVEASRKHRAKPEYRTKILKRMYGITAEQYDAMLLKQDNKCAICLQEDKGKRLAVDHCHKTGRIRGLLCGNCNLALGLLQDNPDLLNKAAAYLKY
jgi:hypothetical protein